MSDTADLNPTIVDALYREALALSDDARDEFDLSGKMLGAVPLEHPVRIALSCERLRTTTRMMHALAWLLNRRAFFAGELSEFQLSRHGRLPARQPAPDATELALLPAALAELIARTQRFYARVERLDFAWHRRFAAAPPVHQLRERLGQMVAGL